MPSLRLVLPQQLATLVDSKLYDFNISRPQVAMRSMMTLERLDEVLKNPDQMLLKEAVALAATMGWWVSVHPEPPDKPEQWLDPPELEGPSRPGEPVITLLPGGG